MGSKLPGTFPWSLPTFYCSLTFQVHLYDPYDDDYYQTVPLDSHQAMYVTSDYYGNQYGGMSRPLPHPFPGGHCHPPISNTEEAHFQKGQSTVTQK